MQGEQEVCAQMCRGVGGSARGGVWRGVGGAGQVMGPAAIHTRSSGARRGRRPTRQPTAARGEGIKAHSWLSVENEVMPLAQLRK